MRKPSKKLGKSSRMRILTQTPTPAKKTNIYRILKDWLITQFRMERK